MVITHVNKEQGRTFLLSPLPIKMSPPARRLMHYLEMMYYSSEDAVADTLWYVQWMTNNLRPAERVDVGRQAIHPLIIR